MRIQMIPSLLVLTAFLFVIQWSRPAAADATLKGTVGEINAIAGVPNGGAAIRFNFTDATQTANCGDANNGGFFAKYAHFSNQDPFYKEWYAMLLVSKKGAPLSCVVQYSDLGNGTFYCNVKSCMLP